MALNIVPEAGERGIIIGQTGSGKTAFNVWLLSFMPGTVIYDTKIEPKFNALPNSVIVYNWDDVVKAFSKKQQQEKPIDYVIFRPPVSELTDPDILDNYLQLHYNAMRGVNIYVDEIYMFHKNARPGPGLVSVLTRGRSRRITCLMSTQRPRWLSGFCMTESQRFYIFRIISREDRMTLNGIVPDIRELPMAAKYHFYYYDHDLEAPIYFNPVPLDVGEADAYTDTLETPRVWI